MNDELGKRMKEQYEFRTRVLLPRRTYTIIRVDGKAFHTLTRGCKKPFDTDVYESMNEAALFLCRELQGAQFAYVQSDEISILLTDFSDIKTEAAFNGNLQKLVSISASIATVRFNERWNYSSLAMFDSRVFTVPDPTEVENYFIWRQKDAERNSVQMVARSLYSHKECYEKSNSELQDMIHKAGRNWNDYPVGDKRGRVVVKEKYMVEGVERSKWIISGPPIFTQDREFLENLIPKYE